MVLLKNHRKWLPVLIAGFYLCVAGSHQASAQQTEPTQWLTQRLNSYFKDSISMQDIVTKRYAAFKTDAMQADMDGGMGLEAFHKKWKHIYDTNQPGLHEGFLIPLQDWQEVTVHCRLISKTPKGWQVQAIITETIHQLRFIRNVLLVKDQDLLRIDDVQCVNN